MYGDRRRSRFSVTSHPARPARRAHGQRAPTPPPAGWLPLSLTNDQPVRVGATTRTPQRVRGGGIGPYLADATGAEAQLALSFIVWPGEAPDPRLVDEWVRRSGAEWLPERRSSGSRRTDAARRTHDAPAHPA
jgi:hypothetical protein